MVVCESKNRDQNESLADGYFYLLEDLSLPIIAKVAVVIPARGGTLALLGVLLELADLIVPVLPLAHDWVPKS